MPLSRSRRSRTPVSSQSDAVAATNTAPQAMSTVVERRVDKVGSLARCLLVLLGLVAFGNGVYGQFVLDDIYEIEQNPEMSYLLPPWRAALAGKVIPARPIPYYTFAIDTALWHRKPMGYHLFNIGLHLSSALLLFSIVRRTLQSPKLVERYGRSATTLAFVVAAFWVVHPIQTQAVTYIYQRLESLMSFLFLAAFYCFVRSKDSARPSRWLIGSVGCTLAAVMSKESAVAIPPLLFLYDVVFWTDSWRQTLRARLSYYIALLITYIPLLVLLAAQSKKYEEFRAPRSALGYAASQPIILLRYLQICFWPTGQCLDYLWQRETEPLRIFGPLVLIGALFVAGVYGLIKRRPWGWLVAAFLLPLLPTSSVIPVNDLANEHRMYLALGAVATAVVLAGFSVYQHAIRAGAKPRLVATSLRLAVAAAIVVLSCATIQRNRVYHDRIGMWEDVVAKAPHNTRGFENLAAACLAYENYPRAAEASRRVITDPRHRHRGYSMLGSALLYSGDTAGAIEYLTKAIELDPDSPFTAKAYVNLAYAVRKTDPKRSAELYGEALRVDPRNIRALVSVANSHARVGDYDRAEDILRYAQSLDPDDPYVIERLQQVLEDKRAGR